MIRYGSLFGSLNATEFHRSGLRSFTLRRHEKVKKEREREEKLRTKEERKRNGFFFFFFIF